VVELLISLLNHSEWEMRCGAVISIGRLGDKRAIPTLTIALQDENHEVRRRAAMALKKIGKDKLSN
jgi:HEAT repeat protein